MGASRDEIISTLLQHLERQPAVLAVWLEGADAVGRVDPFSDIDFCCSVQAGTMDAVTALARAALERLGRLDLDDTSSREPDRQATVFHLEGASPYLLVDFNVYVGCGSTFFEDDELEKPLVLFDRGGVVRHQVPDRQQLLAEQKARLRVLEDTVAQVSRVEKYILRGDFLEAFGYYHKWLLAPLIEVVRMRYTPLHTDYYIVHISRHLPAEVLRRLEDCFQVSSLADLEVKSRRASAFFEETVGFLRNEVGLSEK